MEGVESVKELLTRLGYTDFTLTLTNKPKLNLMTDQNKIDQLTEENTALKARLANAIIEFKKLRDSFKATPKKATPVKRFVPPTPEEVANYMKEKNLSIDANAFLDFYESKGWMIGKNKIKDWKACVRTWNRNNPSKPKPKSNADDWANAGRMV